MKVRRGTVETTEVCYERLETVLLRFNLPRKQGKVPEGWDKAVINIIYTIGPRDTCDNYRGSSLLFTAPNADSLSGNEIEEPTENCCGYTRRRGRNSMDAILLLERVLLKKKEKNITTYLRFADYIQACESASRDELWEAFESYR